jgi:hypothetical protein
VFFSQRKDPGRGQLGPLTELADRAGVEHEHADSPSPADRVTRQASDCRVGSCPTCSTGRADLGDQIGKISIGLRKEILPAHLGFQGLPQKL